MFSSEIAAVGDFDTVSIFRSMGVRVYPVNADSEGEAVFSRVLKEGYDVIFLTERLAEKWSSLVEEVRLKWSPMVVLIPDQRGSTGLAFRNVRETIRRAIGADILKEAEKD